MQGHFLFHGLPMEFRVENQSIWNVHQAQIKDLNLVRKTFSVLAESDNGPIIIEHQSTVAVQFAISVAYPMTRQIVENFILKTVNEVQSVGREDVSLERAAQEQKTLLFQSMKVANRAAEEVQTRLTTLERCRTAEKSIRRNPDKAAGTFFVSNNSKDEIPPMSPTKINNALNKDPISVDNHAAFKLIANQTRGSKVTSLAPEIDKYFARNHSHNQLASPSR